MFGRHLIFPYVVYVAQTEVKSLRQKSQRGDTIGFVIREGRPGNHEPSWSLKSTEVIHFSWQARTGWRKRVFSSDVSMCSVSLTYVLVLVHLVKCK